MAINGTAPTTGDLMRVSSTITRLHYFHGQLLTQRDLEAEQRFHLLLQRLTQREAFGTGTVAGLKVDMAGVNTPRSVLVRAGLAMDPDGRELVLPGDACVTIAEPAASPNATPYIAGPTYGRSDIASQVITHWNASFGASDVDWLWDQWLLAGLTEIAADDPATDNFTNTATQLNKITKPSGFTLPSGQLLREVLFDAIVATTYIGLRFIERGAEPSPAVLDASCCGASTCFPSRLEEGVTIVADPAPFPALRDPFEEAKASLEACLLAQEQGAPTGNPHDCRACLCGHLLDSWRGLPMVEDPCGSAALPIVPLAEVRWSRFERETANQRRILHIDNCTFRPLAPGAPQVRALLAVLTQCTPSAPIPPRFDQISPAHRDALTVSGTTASVRARSTTALSTPIPQATWAITHYPAAAASPVSWSDASQPDTNTYNFTIQAQSTVENGQNFVELVFTSISGPLVLPPGQYVWRLNTDDGLTKNGTTVSLDGEPRPPSAIPSGDEEPGGAFEAIFYVR